MFGCRQEIELHNHGESHDVFAHKSRVRLLKGAEAEKISNLLSSQLHKLHNKNLFSKGSPAEIDYSEITEIIDSLGIANYTFRINNHPDDDYRTFHNLVLTDNDSELEVNVLKFKMSETLALEYQQTGELDYFEGTVQNTTGGPSTNTGGNTGGGCPPISTGGQGGGSGTPGNTGDTGNTGGDGDGDGGGGGESCVLVEISYTCSCGRSYGDFGDIPSTCGTADYPITITITYRTANLGCKQFTSSCALDGDIAIMNPVNNPCEKVKTSTDNTKYKSNLTTLQEKTGDNFESGFRLGTPVAGSGKTDTQNQILQNRPGTKEVDMKIFSNTFALMHSHYDGLFPIFSPGDILLFNQWIVWANSWNAVATNTPKIPLNNLTLTLVTSNGNYLLAFDGSTMMALPTYTRQQFDDLNTKYVEDYLNQTQTNGNFDMDKVEKEFLKFVKDKMNVTGLKLFKVSSSGTNTEIYIENGNRKTKQCP